VQAFKVAAPRSGAVLEVLAADDASAWGRRPWLAVADELAQWPPTGGPRRMWEAVSSAAAKVAGARLVVLTTAGDPAHWSRRVLDHALADPLWRVHEVAGPPPWLDPAKLAEQRRRLPESLYARLFENVWTSAEDRLVSAEDLDACVVLDGPLPPVKGRRYVVGVDVGLKHDRTVAAVCHAEPMPGSEFGVRVVLDRMQVWQGTRLRPVRLATVEEWIAHAAAEYGARVLLDPWQAVGMLQRLRGRRVPVREFTFSAQSVGRLASTLHLLLREHALALPDDPELLDELANVRLRETSPGVVRMDHDAGRHDDRAIALALAAAELLARPTPPKLRQRVGVPPGRLPDALAQLRLHPVRAEHELPLRDGQAELAGMIGLARSRDGR
jgi:phage terminase large subunit-like protein